MLALYLGVLDGAEDKALFEKLYITYRQPMLYRARAILENDTDAEDAVHEVFLQIATKYMYVMKGIHSERYMKGYLLKAVRNTALDMLEKRKHTYTSFEALDEAAVQPLSDDDFLDQICKRGEYDRIVEAILHLDRVYSDVLYFHFVLELSAAETAAILSRNLATVKKQLVRGKQLLLQTLNDEGGVPGDNDERGLPQGIV